MYRVIGGRYGLSSKEFTPAMVKGVFDELKKSEPKNHFSIGIDDDVTFTSIPFDQSSAPSPTIKCAQFFGDWERMEQSAPTRTPSRSLAKKPQTTHRVILFTTRRRPAR